MQTTRPPAAGPLAVVVGPAGVALADEAGSRLVTGRDPADVVRELDAKSTRLVWWSARETARRLVAAGLRPEQCWDLGAVGMSLYGLRRDDPAGVWAASHGLPEPGPQRAALDLFDVDHSGTDATWGDGQLSPEWVAGGWSESGDTLRRWAELAHELYRWQRDDLTALPDPRRSPVAAPLALLNAYAESAVAMLAVELEHDGLPVDADVAADLLRATIGERPADDDADLAMRKAREREVLRHFPGEPACDLRSPEQVRALLARIGLDLVDTRSWRLEPHAATSPAVAALLAWRKADRIVTTYGWRWLDGVVAGGGRLRGRWYVADGGAGRMTAGSGLHNLPAPLRPAIRAEPGHVLVRADLGQIEPRVLATVSGDPALTKAAQEPDMYAPVAAALGCDRPTAKVAVLAAMYGQTSGTAGAALRDMGRVYSSAMAYLRSAESCARERHPVRTWGGRLVRFGDPDTAAAEQPAQLAARGRYGRNAVIQGAAAELFKAWAATVRHGVASLDGRIVLCLHDELVLHVPESVVGEASELLTDALASMTSWWAAGSGVRFVAEVTSGTNWADAH